MELASLQKNGVIHIGLRKSPAVLYACRLPSRPECIFLGSAFNGTVTVNGQPAVQDVLEAYEGATSVPEFIMICHHSSASEIVQKIDVALDDKKVDGIGKESWFEATLDEIIYAYPPFAKIFLSEIPEAAGSHAVASPAGSDRGSLDEGGISGGAGIRGLAGASGDPEHTETWADVVLLKTEQSRTVVSLALILGMVLTTGYLGLESIRNSDKEGTMLSRLASVVGIALDDTGPAGSGADVGEDGGEYVEGQAIPANFETWYSPTRGGDTGITYGLPREQDGFDVKTWTSGEKDEQRLLAAYRYSGPSPYQHRSEAERAASKEILGDLLDTRSMIEKINQRACSVVFGPRSERLTDDEFRQMELLLVHEDVILKASKLTAKDC